MNKTKLKEERKTKQEEGERGEKDIIRKQAKIRSLGIY